MMIRDRVKELRRVNASELIPHPKNWRRHPSNQQKAMRAALKEIGFADALIAYEDEQGRLVLIDGHLRADITGDTKVPVLVLDLSEKESAKLLATLDPLAGMAALDEKAWATLIGNIDSDSPEFRSLLNELNPEPTFKVGLVDEDSAPVLPTTPVTQPGDLWTLGPHRVLCGDSKSSNAVRQLMGQEHAETLFSDPPYNMSYGGGRGKQGFGPITNDDLRGEEFEAFLHEVLINACANMKPGAAAYLCCTWRTYVAFWTVMATVGLEPGACVVWDKGHVGLGYSHYRPRHEFLLYRPGTQWFGQRDESDVWEISRDAAVEYEHPTQKPIALVQRALRNSSRTRDVVLDVFGGSGSTLIGCETTNRVARLLEIDPKFVDVTVRRWETFSGKQAVLDGDGRTFEAIRKQRLGRADLPS